MKSILILLAGSVFATIALGQAQTVSTPPKSDWANLRLLTAGAEIRVISTGQQTIRGTFRSVSDDTLIVGQPSGERMLTRSTLINIYN
jgi:hypothetical protein